MADLTAKEEAFKLLAGTLTAPEDKGVLRTDLGLGSVDDTADLAKPVSTAQQSAIDAGVATVTTTSLGLNLVENTADADKDVATAGALTVATTINGVSFDGSAPITVPAEADTLIGATLPITLTQSDLTRVGAITIGLWTASPIADAYISSAPTWNAKGPADQVATYVSPQADTHTTGDYVPDALASNVIILAWNGPIGELSTPTNLVDGDSMTISGVKSGGAHIITGLGANYRDMHGLISDLSTLAAGKQFSLGIQKVGTIYQLYIALEA